MIDLSPLYALMAQLLPFECMQARFMQQAMIGLLLLAPMTAIMGIQVVNFRMAFFADAISHSAFAGVALGLLFGGPRLDHAGLRVLVGPGNHDYAAPFHLSSDTVIGVFFSAMVALAWPLSAGTVPWLVISSAFSMAISSPSAMARSFA
jgi:zinc transport system permease protein